MPHISVKMLGGRTAKQKEQLAINLAETLSKTLNCPKTYVTLTIEDYTAAEWQEEFKKEVTDKNQECVYIKPQYDPKSLL